MFRIYFFVLLSFSLFLSGYSQDAFFTNTNQSLIYLNPSFAGTNGFVREQSAFRLQDNNEHISFRTFYTCLDAFIAPVNGGLAISFLSDNQLKSLVRTYAPSIAYAQHIKLYKKTLKVIPAIQATYVMKSADLKNVGFLDTLDYRKTYIYNTAEVFPVQQKSFIDVNASLLLQSKNLTIGLGMFHFNQPDEGFAGPQDLSFKINLHAAYNFSLTSDLTLSLFGAFISQDNFKDYIVNCNLSWNKEVFVGVGLRKANTFNANVGFQADAFRLGIGYDYGFGNSETNIYGKNSFEVMVSFNFTSVKSENLYTADWLTW